MTTEQQDHLTDFHIDISSWHRHEFRQLWSAQNELSHRPYLERKPNGEEPAYIELFHLGQSMKNLFKDIRFHHLLLVGQSIRKASRKQKNRLTCTVKNLLARPALISPIQLLQSPQNCHRHTQPIACGPHP